MKTRYRRIVRRKTEAGRHLRLRAEQRERLLPRLDDPIEMPSEIIDIATAELLPPRRKERP